jgi:hypothetical protein
MNIRIGLVASFLVVALQWFIVVGFVEHSYAWWLKASDPVVTAGIAGTIILSIGSMLTVGFSLWAHGQLCEQEPRLKYVAQLLGLAGLSGLLVFFGMVSIGYVLLVHR